jgi:hypothetical protein
MMVVGGKGRRSERKFGLRGSSGARPGTCRLALPQPSSAANDRGSVIHPAFHLLSRTESAPQADPAHSFHNDESKRVNL